MSVSAPMPLPVSLPSVPTHASPSIAVPQTWMILESILTSELFYHICLFLACLHAIITFGLSSFILFMSASDPNSYDFACTLSLTHFWYIISLYYLTFIVRVIILIYLCHDHMSFVHCSLERSSRMLEINGEQHPWKRYVACAMSSVLHIVDIILLGGLSFLSCDYSDSYNFHTNNIMLLTIFIIEVCGLVWPFVTILPVVYCYFQTNMISIFAPYIVLHPVSWRPYYEIAHENSDNNNNHNHDNNQVPIAMRRHRSRIRLGLTTQQIEMLPISTFRSQLPGATDVDAHGAIILTEMLLLNGNANRSIQLDPIPEHPDDRDQEQQQPSASCSICLGEYQDNDVIRRLSCIHGFHKTCIDQWLARRNTCPLCFSPALATHHLRLPVIHNHADGVIV